MREKLNIGDIFGRWTIADNEYVLERGHRKYMCECSCGKHTRRYVDEYNLKCGKSLSCGCISSELTRQRRLKHGKSNTRLFHIWCGIRERCYTKTRPEYKEYGGRGITICDEWNDFETFEKWAFDNGYDESAPKGECTIDRIDVNGNYESSNCRWISLTEQSDNRTNTIRLTYNGKTQTLLQWSKELNLNYKTMSTRYYEGWAVEEILNPNHERIGKNVIEYKGEVHTLNFWAKKLGLSNATMWRRYSKGYPLDIVFSKESLIELKKRGIFNEC